MCYSWPPWTVNWHKSLRANECAERNWTPQPLWPGSLRGVIQFPAMMEKRVNQNDNGCALCCGACEPFLATTKLLQSSSRRTHVHLFFKHFANHKVHIGLPPKNTTNASYTVTRHKIKLQIRVNFGKLRFSKTVEKLGLQRVYRRSAEKKKRGMKKSVWSASQHQELQLWPHRECKASPARAWGGMGALTNSWWEGTALPTLLALPTGYFAHCPLAFTSSSRPFLSPLFFFLSVGVHFETRPLWRVKGPTS